MKVIYGIKGTLDMADSNGNKIESREVFFIVNRIVNNFEKERAIIEGDIFSSKRSFKNGDGNINSWFYGDKRIRWSIDNNIYIHDSEETDLYDTYCSGRGNSQRQVIDLLKKLDGEDEWDNVKINFREFTEYES